MNIEQEPKYDVDRNTGQIYNRETGVAIPDDEPVMIFRAKDAKALHGLLAYMHACEDVNHKNVVQKRICQFIQFAGEHLERMKEPDSAPA